MNRAYYSEEINTFIKNDNTLILGQLAKNNQFSLEDLQRNAWLEEIRILKRELNEFRDGFLALEYTIPRIGDRVDGVFLYNGLIFLLEFKVGESRYKRDAMDQVMDYALDLKNFHKESHTRKIIPILIATRAPSVMIHGQFSKDGIFDVQLCNDSNIKNTILSYCQIFTNEIIDPNRWINSIYMPTPTIIEAAQALYRGHSVKDISRSDAGAMNMTATCNAISTIIEESKRKQQKSICFITGVPGSGKTLAGLNIANERQKLGEDEHAVFLSGNQPLVGVLQEALARDDRLHYGIQKTMALRKAKTFIQIIHHFRDDAISVETAPTEKVVIFDEAQRAWENKSLENFMARKKGVPNFNMSEPEFLISIMDRHQNWAVIICLIGGGQEINTGEAGLQEWFVALKRKFPGWHVYISDRLGDSEYVGNRSLSQLLNGLQTTIVEELHLSVSLRSFRSEKVSEFVKALLDNDLLRARTLYYDLEKAYPIILTRDFEKAKAWLRDHARGTERYGITASSGAKRLRSFGIWVQSKIDANNWFLNGKSDVRSSFFLEETATEFDIQGLELDWTIVCWDANFRFDKGGFHHYDFRGASWQRINNPNDRNYLKNAYRVLLTRARQGFVIFIPHGDKDDPTRLDEYYDGTYHYLREIGISEIV